MRTEWQAGGRRIALVRGDITTIATDAIVNAANSALAGGGGVDGAIHRAGGPSIMAELRSRHPTGCPTGGAVVTGAGRLPARWVVHAVGPVWRGGGHGEAALLASAYRNALARADEAGARSVTLPAISAGVYGYPLDDAARIALATVATALAESRSVVDVTFVLYAHEVLAAFAAALEELDARWRPAGGDG